MTEAIDKEEEELGMAHVRRHPKSGRWQVCYRDPDGKERALTRPTKIEADRLAATMTADVVRGDYLDPQLGKVPVSEFAERWQATRSHLAQATRDQDRHYLDSLVLRSFGPPRRRLRTDSTPDLNQIGRLRGRQLETGMTKSLT